jgi:hypothetical protein
MSSLDVPEGAKAPGRGPACSTKKNRQFLAKPAETRYCFSEVVIGASVLRARNGSTPKVADFGTAPNPATSWLKKPRGSAAP